MKKNTKEKIKVNLCSSNGEEISSEIPVTKMKNRSIMDCEEHQDMKMLLTLNG